ncbi:MAG: hypothetical protein JO128_08770, partial [Alphaproteobacteria bacterium]|nr:hypothetical protein [Alphaproteobacteria bacterium]
MRPAPSVTREKLRRIGALVRKETAQLFRDSSSIAIGIAMPIALILVFGYALSLDVKHVPAAVVLEDSSPAAVELAAGFTLSPYFDASLVETMPRARQM